MQKHEQAIPQGSSKLSLEEGEAPFPACRTRVSRALFSWFIFEPAPGESRIRDTMKKDMHVQKTTKAGVTKAVALTYVLLESPSVELQADHRGRVKTSRLSKNPASYLITWSQLFEGFGFEGLFLSHLVQRKPIQSVGNKVSTTDLKELAFPPSERTLEGRQENSPGYIVESYPEVVPLPLHLKEVKKEVNRGSTTQKPEEDVEGFDKGPAVGV